MINKLIKLRLLKKNNYNIKYLFLNNLNKKEELDLNKREINYSIFDKKETYEILLKSKRKYFLGR